MKRVAQHQWGARTTNKEPTIAAVGAFAGLKVFRKKN